MTPGASATTTCGNESSRLATLSASLPDCRAYEQVSPEETGGDNATQPHGQSQAQVSPSGEGIAYASYEAFPGAPGNPLGAMHLSRRGSSDWSTTELVPAKTTAEPGGGYQDRYPALSSNLTEVVLYAKDQLLTTNALPGIGDLFLRREAEDGSYGYSLINSAVPEELPPPECAGECAERGLDEITYQGASSGFGHIVFRSNAIYGPESPRSLKEVKYQGFKFFKNVIYALYESFAGQVHLVSYAPDGEAIATIKSSRLYGMTSASGTRVIFEARSKGATAQEAEQSGDDEVYDRIDGEHTVELSGPAPGAKPASSEAKGRNAHFWAASSDGARVFITSEQELTSNSTATAKAPDLYEFDFPSEGAIEGTLTDLTVDGNAGEHADVLGIVEASKDGEYIYFVADGQLATGATAGQPNLYMVRAGGAPVFIATLNAATDALDWTEQSEALHAYVTPDGRQMAFMTTQKLPSMNFPGGYENAGYTEVYEYTAPTAAEEVTGKTGELACASCDSSRATAVGNALIGGAPEEALEGSSSTPFYRVRALSADGGRLFFTAAGLAAENAPVIGGQSPYTKVYEYERNGTGSCMKTSGCLYLISSPTNRSSDYFLDASESGNDVFFATTSQLGVAERGEITAVYDARVEGAPAKAIVVATECEAPCRKQGGSVEPGPPLLSMSTGASGNLRAAAPTEAKKSKAKKKKTASQIRVERLKKALRRCRRDRTGKKRRRCEVRARARYVTPRKRTTAAKRRQGRRGN